MHATGRRQFGRGLRRGHSSTRTTMRRVMALIWVRAGDTRTHARSGRMAGTDSWAVAEEVQSSDEKDQTEQARVRSHLAVAAGTSSCGTLAEHDLSATCRWELPRAGIAGCTGRWLDRVGGGRVDPPANRGEPGRIRADKTVNCRMGRLTVSPPGEWAATARAGHVACSTDRAAPRPLLETPGAGRLGELPERDLPPRDAVVALRSLERSRSDRVPLRPQQADRPPRHGSDVPSGSGWGRAQ